MTTKKKQKKQYKPKSNEILPTHDYYRKRVDIVEEITGKKISIEYRATNANYIKRQEFLNGLESPEEGYGITIATPAIKGIPTKTAIYHEMSHALHNTFMSGYFEKIKRMSEITAHNIGAEQEVCDLNKLLKEDGINITVSLEPVGNPRVRSEIIYTNHAGERLKNSEVNDTILKCDAGKATIGVGTLSKGSINRMNNKLVSRLTQQLQDDWTLVYNVLEDQRIESLTSKIWLGTKSMFTDARHAVGKRLEKNDTIVEQLLAARMFRDDLVKDKELIDNISEVEGTSAYAPIAVFQDELLPKLVDEAKKRGDNLKDDLEEQEQVNSEYDKTYDEKEELVGSFNDNNGVASTQEEIDKLQGLQNKLDELCNRSTELNNKLDPKHGRSLNEASEYQKRHGEEVRDQIANDQTGLYEREDSYQDRVEDIKKIDNVEGEMDNLDHEEVIQICKEEGEENVVDIQSSIKGMIAPKTPANIKMVKRMTVEPDKNEDMVHELNTILRRMKERETNTLSDTGDEIDIDAYVNTRVSGHGDPFISTKKDVGLSVFVSIDGSGSMDHNNKIGKAQTLVSSLFRISKQHNELIIRGNVWSSDHNGDVGLTEINTLKDCEMISTSVHSGSGSFYETPTHEGLKHSAKTLRTMKAKNKLLILITDGYPQFSKNGHSLGDGQIKKLCKKALKSAKQSVNNVMCINIEPNGYTSDVLREIFGKHLIEFPSMDRAAEFIQKEVKTKLIQVMRQ